MQQASGGGGLDSLDHVDTLADHADAVDILDHSRWSRFLDFSTWSLDSMKEFMEDSMRDFMQDSMQDFMEILDKEFGEVRTCKPRLSIAISAFFKAFQIFQYLNYFIIGGVIYVQFWSSSFEG